MKKFIFLFASIIGLIGLFLFGKDYLDKQEQSFSGYCLSSNEIRQIQNGDIILRKGYGTVSDLISKTLHEEYDVSHCAIIHKFNDSIEVIHAVSQSLSDFDGVQTQSLKRFINDSKPNSIILLRYNSDLHDQSKIADRAIFYLRKKIPFDHGFDIKDSSQFYCTELIWKVIKDTYNKDILCKTDSSDEKSHFKFKCFWNSTNFKIIFNHQLKKKI